MPILVKRTIDELLLTQKEESTLPVSRVLLEEDEPRLGEYVETPEQEPAPLPEPPESIEQPSSEEVNVPEPGEDVPLPETGQFEPPEVGPKAQPEPETKPLEDQPEPPLPETTQAVAPDDFEVPEGFGEMPVVTELPEAGPPVPFPDPEWPMARMEFEPPEFADEEPDTVGMLLDEQAWNSMLLDRGNL